MIKFKYFMHKYGEDGVSYHYHKYYELTYYKEGSGYTTYSKYKNNSKINEDLTSVYVNKSKEKYTKIDFKENSILIYPPYTIHNKKHKGTSDIYAFVFDIFDTDLSFSCTKVENVSYKIRKLLDLAIEEYNERKYKYVENINNILSEICIEIKRETEFEKTIEKNDSMDEVLSYIDDYFLTDIDFLSLSEKCHYSPDRFRHIFKERTGYSPKQYVINKKMDYAKEQIVNTKLKLMYIALACGYEDYAQFSAYFKKYFGVSPSELRNNKKEV